MIGEGPDIVGRASDPNKGIKTLIQALAHTPSRLHLTLIDNDHHTNAMFMIDGDGNEIKVMEIRYDRA